MSTVAVFPSTDSSPSTARSSQLLNERQAAAYLHPDLHHRTLERWRRTGDGPVFVRVGRRVGYRQADLDEFIEQQRRDHTRAKAAK
jgi:hypothetical protein